MVAFLAVFLGTFGIHHFYRGKRALGFLYLIFFWTGIPTILGIFEGFWLTKQPRLVALFLAFMLSIPAMIVTYAVVRTFSMSPDEKAQMAAQIAERRQQEAARETQKTSPPPATAGAENESDPQEEALAKVADLLPGNRFNISRKDLRTKVNPAGSGVFVYVRPIKVADYERLLIWFVNGNAIAKLNGATNNVTPAVPFPRDAPSALWNGIGLSSEEHWKLTELGLSVAYGR